MQVELFRSMAKRRCYLRRENQVKMPSTRAAPGMKKAAHQTTVRYEMGLRETPYCWGFFGAMSRTAFFFTSQSRLFVKKFAPTVSTVSFSRNLDDPTATMRVANIVALVVGSVVVPPSYAAAMVTGPGMSAALL